MRLDLPTTINREQWLKRLGVTGAMPEGLELQLEAAEKKLMEAAVPQGVYKIVEKDSMELPGESIKRHLEECREMAVMAVTLGAGVERLIRISQIRDMAEAVLLDSGASVLAEQVCDGLEEVVKAEGVYMTPRYSPGYGDFPIEMQGQLTKLLDTHRQMGLSVNESYILLPRKSITAIAGVADHPVRGHMASCDECLIREECTLKKEGKLCWT